MKIILVMVLSLDGKTTKWRQSDIHEWTSKEDFAYFSSLIQKASLVIMGRKTFDAARKMMTLSPKTLRVVITKKPHKYTPLSVPNQLEFISDDLKTLMEKMNRRGIKKALLVGGETLNTHFFREKLINEVWLTIEPIIIGIGNGLVLQEKLNVDLSLKNMQLLNKKGTILMKYRVNYLS